ncbi:hypothetical protein DICPUDRAFT_80861 [Dictyostelium purpureum]|uniref:Uncharacterized protein n=1 Tax=Dictyostelium purpureum TaxID=5786 RepID=F0ZRR9_DICPU|nr:uncharacterized protein DICPUDRAFT_80861 [Dictyostelium purpureum]EGC33366.1 hypothetical protein DICPUDRAFT_80861 [Dictyostelium purpureum]|eukprot:XP_003290117.1 hypothetical protein DICPUDRAFT_80861 [Dictyostelium purpureum]
MDDEIRVGFQVIGFYVFFITTIVLEKYTSNSINFHFIFPYEKDFERNKFLYKKAECLTICNLKEDPFEILLSLNKKSKIKTYKPVIIEGYTGSELSCITTAKKKGNFPPEIVDKFKLDKLTDRRIKINKLASVGRKENDKGSSITHSSISIFTHRFREGMDIDNIMHHSLNINYNSTESHIVLKKYNENSFVLALKDNGDKEEEILIDSLYSVLNGNQYNYI